MNLQKEIQEKVAIIMATTNDGSLTYQDAFNRVVIEKLAELNNRII